MLCSDGGGVVAAVAEVPLVLEDEDIRFAQVFTHFVEERFLLWINMCDDRFYILIKHLSSQIN